jgi:hypothetical protein
MYESVRIRAESSRRGREASLEVCSGCTYGAGVGQYLIESSALITEVR